VDAFTETLRTELGDEAVTDGVAEGLSHVYAKLGVRNRSELAMLAARRGSRRTPA
jgi:hypothetical protein